MAKDNIEFKSLISLDLNFDSPVNNSIDCKSQISNELNFDSVIGIDIIRTEYRTGVVSNAFFGETAVFDFEAKINIDTDVVFTVDWGAEVGTTIINAALVGEVWKVLQTSILIPEGVDLNQTINVSDTLGGSYQLPYTVEEDASYPAVIDDGNTVGFYLSDELGTITKDASDFVSEWRDFLGSGHDLLQETGSSQSKWFLNDGVLFDGIDDFMKTLAFTYNQPEQIYIVFNQVTWTFNDYIFDGNFNVSGSMRQLSNSSELRLYAGGISAVRSTSLNVYHIARVIFNGANSKFRIDNGTEISGNYGTNNMGGFTLGSVAQGGNNAHIQIKEIILRKIADSPTDEQNIYDYLANKYSI